MRKIVRAALACGLALVCSAAALAAGGTAEDPLITLSKLRSSYLDTIQEAARQKAAALQSQAEQTMQEETERAKGALQAKAIGIDLDQVASQVRQQVGGTQMVTLEKGDQVTGPLGAGFVLREGSAKIVGTELINITAGGTRPAGNAIAQNIYYLIPQQDGSGIEITSDTAVVQLRDGAASSAAAPAYQPQYQLYADGLKAMGLFRGSDLGYELERQPTRLETLIMLIRLLGEEEEVLAYTGSHPFTDVTGWEDANKYIAYAVSKGYTNGVSATEFAPQSPANAATMYTYVLRALGYSDQEGDFVWNSTDRTLAVEIGLLSQSQMEQIQQGIFRRDQAVFLCWQALSVHMKGTQTDLATKLIGEGAVTWQQYEEAKQIVGS